MNDRELLREYVEQRSPAAFKEMLRRHLNLVYGTALRQVRDPHLAQDVSQAVFVRLARLASNIRDGAALPAWLHRAAYTESLRRIRAEQRRRRRELEAVRRAALKDQPEAVAAALAPLIDEALQQLPEDDQTALTLRYFEGRSLDDVGAALDVSEDAAQKRVSRALEKLREHFARAGLRSTAAVLAGTLGALAGAPAPTQLAAKIFPTALERTRAGNAGPVAVGILLAALLALVTGLALRRAETPRPLMQPVVSAVPVPAVEATDTAISPASLAADQATQRPAAALAASAATTSGGLSLRLQGAFQYDATIDLTIPGRGARFSGRLPAADGRPHDFTVNARIVKEGDTYVAGPISLGWEVPVVAQTSSRDGEPSRNITSITTLGMSASHVRLRPGQPMVLIEENGRQLTLTLSLAP